MIELKNCNHCKAPLDGSEVYCPHCGQTANSVTDFPSSQTRSSDQLHPASSTGIRKEEIQKASNSFSYEEHRKILWRKLETYRDKLLRLEQSNRSILLRRIYAKWSFDLSRLSIRESPVEQLLIERAFKKKNALCLIPDSDDSELADKDRTKLRSLSRNTTQLQLETGLQEAYFGFPFLVGHIGVDTYVRAPLVLFPISIEYKKLARPSGWYLNFLREKPIIINRALMALLKKKGRIAVQDSFYEQFEDIIEELSNFDGSKQDSVASDIESDEKSRKKIGTRKIESYFIKKVTDLLLNNGFPANILESKFDEITLLEPLTSEQQSILKKEELRLVNFKIIGHFPQGDSSIYTDYEDLMRRAQSGETNQGIIDNLLEIPSPDDSWNGGENDTNIPDEIDLDSIPAESLNLVLQSDSSQEAVIVAAESAECTVVRGPPGTGKSQAIVNLIANALAKHKKVLLVCQKRAALDVVYQRLNKVGLSRYVALLHDPSSDRKDLYRQLSQLLNYGTSSTDPSLESVDSQIEIVSKSINRLVNSQRTITSALSKKYFGGVSAHYLYAHAQPGYIGKLDLSRVSAGLNYYQLKELIFAVGSLESDTKKFDNHLHEWYNRNSFSKLNIDEKKNMITTFDELIQLIKSDNILVLADSSKQAQLVTALDILSTTNNIFERVKSPLTKGNDTAKRFINDPGFVKGQSSIMDPLVAGADQGLLFWNSLKKFENFINDEIFVKRGNTFVTTSSLDKNKLSGILEEIGDTANDNILIVLPDTSKQTEIKNLLEFLSSTKGMFRNSKSSVKRANETLEILVNDQEFDHVDSHIRNRIQSYVQPAYQIVKEFINDRFDPSDSVMLERLQTDARQGINFWKILNDLHKFLNNKGFQKLSSYVTPGEVNKDQLIEKLQNMQKSIQSDFEQIQAYERRIDSLSDVENSIFQECRLKLIDDSEWSQILEQELYLHWINIIEEQNPVLRNRPFETYINNRELLSSEVKKHRELSRMNISKKIESGIIRPVVTSSKTTSRVNSSATIWASLANDLEKKRRVLPVRKMIEKYSDMIFKMAPCWLASPEAVASVFPLKRNLFDFIIFDEASQSAVERSLTSLYRGHHVVIMGDEKQLRPFDLFRLENEEEEEAEEELVDESLLSESLLVLAKRTYGCRYLVWHYRSKYQELINFSNHAFYDGHLQVAPNTIRTPEMPPIHWVKCENGIWANRQNPKEAYAVVNVIESLLIQDEEEDFRSIGVITFNDTQRTAIMDEIDRRRKTDPTFDELYTAAENPKSKNLDDIPFVKNIENVQGDERDIIIFSVGYAKDLEGKLRLRFGSLNQEGGENRLNVAISRARQAIIVVSSIEPDELKTESAKNAGPRRFRDYLKYARYISEGRNDDVTNLIENLNPNFARNVTSGSNSQTLPVFERTFEEIVYDRLSSLGYQIVSRVGYSGYKIDLAVVHPNDPSKYILGIECDGAMFQSANSTRERDVMRQEFLQSRGWNLERIWSSNWWKSPEKEIERIKQKIEELRMKAELAT